MRRIATVLLGIALVAFYMACAADAPAPTSNNGGGGGPRTTPTPTALQVRLFTTNANPTAGNCTLIQAIVTLNGNNVPDGTGVAFSTDFGFFQQNSNVVVSVTTQGGAAVTALCSSNAGLANVRATATVGSQTGTGTLVISFQPSAQAGPFFSSCSPSFAANTGGTPVTLNGGRFFGTAATTRATFTAAGVTREALVTDVTGSTVTVVTPAFPEAQSPSVPVTINLTFGTNTSSPVVLTIPNCFAFGTASSTTPSITAILPASGSNNGLTRVTIVGSGFSSPLQLFFGPVEAQVVSVSFNQIIALTPPAFGAGAPNLNQTVDVRVHEVTSGVDAVAPAAFRFVTPVQIFSFSGPNVQPIGGPFLPLTIHGQGFEAPVAVSLAGWVATVMSVSATEILVTPGNAIPSSCTDITGPMTVTNVNTGDTASGQTFTYIVKSAGPFISGVSPGSGTGGSITISGGNFSAISTVTVGGRAASFTVDSVGSITATVTGFTPPVCASGVAVGTATSMGDVVVTNAFGCSASAAGAFTLPCIPPPVPTRTPTP
jgi:IPT/TIG domain